MGVEEPAPTQGREDAVVKDLDVRQLSTRNSVTKYATLAVS